MDQKSKLEKPSLNIHNHLEKGLIFQQWKKNSRKFCLTKIIQTLTHTLGSTNNLFQNLAIKFADK